DALDGVLDPALHGAPGPIDGRFGAARLAAPCARAGELTRDGLHLVAGTLGAVGVAPRLGVFGRVPQLRETRAVVAERVRIEQLARVAAIGMIARAGELEDVDGDVGLLDQACEVLDAARCLEAQRAARRRDREVFALRDHRE